ncbi:MAG TPA: helix-turn-helix transcriptional regulator [Pseudonocardiaceae bacterium]|nr:helix-turn-helix transcriptional regulator [Pseudonocardiaceae bacterium]
MSACGRIPLTGGEALSGKIAGTVLQAVRQAIGFTQADLAEHAGAGVTTVQGWETGRRPLINVRQREQFRLRRLLQTAGADPQMLRLLDPALTADNILAEISTPDPELHPLALLVPDRTLTELLAWPITGTPPRQLRGTRAYLPVGAGVREHLVAQLRELAERAPASTTAGAMLRRQAQFLIASHPGFHEWVNNAVRADLAGTRNLGDWSVHWPVARSYAVSSSIAGDPEPLHRFTTEGLATEQGAAANLTYWAYWVGEINGQWASDQEMLRDQSWSGETLLASLIDGIMHAPYRELCAHTLWALLRVKRGLMASPETAARIATAIDTTLSDGMVPDTARRKLEQVDYLVRSR